MLAQSDTFRLPFRDGVFQTVATSPPCYGIIWRMKRNSKGQFIKGQRYSPNTEFKKGEHWRKPKSHWHREWLYNEYITQKRTTSEIAKEMGCIPANIIYWLRKHNIPRRSTAETKAIKHWGLKGKIKWDVWYARKETSKLERWTNS